MTANFYAAVSASLETDGNRVCSKPTTACPIPARIWRVNRRATQALLVDAGAVRGDRIAVQVDKSPASLFLYLGCLRAGLVYLPLNTAYQRSELAFSGRCAAQDRHLCAQSSGIDARALRERHSRGFLPSTSTVRARLADGCRSRLFR